MGEKREALPIEIVLEIGTDHAYYLKHPTSCFFSKFLIHNVNQPVAFFFFNYLEYKKNFNLIFNIYY